MHIICINVLCQMTGRCAILLRACLRGFTNGAMLSYVCSTFCMVWLKSRLSVLKSDSQSWSQKGWSCATCANACTVHPAIRADCVIALTDAIQADHLIEEIVKDPIRADFSHWQSPERWLFHWRKSWKPVDIATACDTLEANVNKVCCQMFRS